MRISKLLFTMSLGVVVGCQPKPEAKIEIKTPTTNITIDKPKTDKDASDVVPKAPQ